MGRKLRWPERMNTKLPAGTFERIVKVLQEGETRIDFVRGTVLAELERREDAQRRKTESKRRMS
jgi:uncharacterized protein (DUF2384 family)